jgi:hypothetical protein
MVAHWDKYTRVYRLCHFRLASSFGQHGDRVDLKQELGLN